jgi:predicted O-methyltransferase YrrM
MNFILEQVFEQSGFVFSNGEKFNLHSNTPKGQCEFLQQIIKENGFKKSIEIGFAYGISSIAICEAIKNNGGNKHLIIDKFQNEGWEGKGLLLAKAAGYLPMIDLREEFCYQVLLTLLKEETRYDFAYIDSVKEFDWILVNFFYLDKILEVGGIIALDDVMWPGIRKVARFVTRLPNYKVVKQFPESSKNLKGSINKLVNYIPYKDKFFRNDILDNDHSLGINSRCVAFRKTEEDTRNWDWFKDF